MINIGLNIIVIIVLIVYFLVCTFKKISFKIAFIVSMIYFILATVFLILEVGDLAINISAIAYYLLIVAVALAIVKYFREFIEKNEEKKLKEMLILKNIDEIKKK